MKFKHTLLSAASVLALILLTGTQNTLHSNQGGPPANRTGAPGDAGNTCASTCHTGSAVVPETGWISSNIPAAGYTPGNTYTISSTASSTGAMEFGFQICSEKSGAAKTGTWLITNTTTTKLVGASRFVTHTSSGVAGTNTKTWSADWTAPAAGTGTVTFYAAFNISNDNNNSAGDLIHTSTLAVEELNTGIASTELQEKELIVYPNPASDFIHVSFPSNHGKSSVHVYDLTGKKVATLFEGNTIQGVEKNLFRLNSQFKSGIYFIQVLSENDSFVSKLLIQ